MKISKFIEYLQEIRETHGEIDVICVTPGPASAWETSSDINVVSGIYKTDADDRDIIESDHHLIIGIDA